MRIKLTNKTALAVLIQNNVTGEEYHLPAGGTREFSVNSPSVAKHYLTAYKPLGIEAVVVKETTRVPLKEVVKPVKEVSEPVKEDVKPVEADTTSGEAVETTVKRAPRKKVTL